ncbi:hypothetical protein A6A40_29745 (plasmid) [Azospirillum humicireducens]|uniref:Uncharacterized protein n=1 Tax=Azospirillum humicireducens TaxID=1226968 RepID=A0A2R4VXG9_9PROT|nr:hypothetical protein [Azospirillum humicireducens]AWB09144.1 hypothetical protein A6A40_29745 [Azospirillum humicireducens]
MPSDEALQDTLSRATVLLNGDARDRERAVSLLADLRDRFPHRPEGEAARRVLVREQPRAWSALDEADGLGDLEADWDQIGRPDDPRVWSLVERTFDTRRIGSERLCRLQERTLDFLAGIDHTTASFDLLLWVARLYDIAASNPSCRPRVARDRDRIALHRFRRQLDTVTPQVVEALDRWDVDAAGAALDTLDPAPEAFAREVAALQARMAEILRRSVQLQAALDRAASATVRSPGDATLLAATLDELAAHRADAVLPERLIRAIAEADAAAAAAVARWGADAAREAQGLDGLVVFQREWARIPPRWQGREQADWFAPAWAAILKQTGNTLARAADGADVDILAKRFHDAAPRLSRPLVGKARAVARTMADLAHAWRQAAAGKLAPLPDLAVMAGSATLPKTFNDLRRAAESADSSLAEAGEALAAAEASADINDVSPIQERLNALCARYPDLERAQRLRERADSIVARAAVRRALAAWRVEEAVVNMRRADPSIDQASLDALQLALGDFARLAAVQANGAMAAQLTWWDGWLMALGKLPELKPWPPGLDTALRTLYRDRLNRFSAAVDAELGDSAKTAAEFRVLTKLFTSVAEFPPLRFEMDRLHRRSIALDVEAAIENADWPRAGTLLVELQAQGEPPDLLAILHLRVELGRAAAAGKLAECLFERWHDVRTLIPGNAPGLVLDALRGRRLNGLEPMALDRNLEDCATHAAKLTAPDSQMGKELAFWAEWSALARGLWKTSAPAEDELLRVSRFYRLVPPQWRQLLVADVHRLISMWKDRGDAVTLAWASRLFATLSDVRIGPDPLHGLLRKADETAKRVVDDLIGQALLSADILKKSRQLLRGEFDRWMALLRLLDAAGDGGHRSIPDALAAAVELVETLATLFDEMGHVEAADFRDEGLGTRIEHVRARMIAVSETANLPGLGTVADSLDRVEQACRVRHVWQEFYSLCALVGRDQAPLDGTNNRIRQLVREIAHILRESGVEDRPGGVSLLRDVTQCLVSANPARSVPSGTMAASDLLDFADQLCGEEEKARTTLILIEQRLPRGTLGNPDDQRYDLFFQSLPHYPPAGSIARQLYRALMRRDPMPGIVRQAPHRLPKWLLTL